MNDGGYKSEDHDLLIKLHTRFETFEKMTTQMWDSLNGKMAQILMEVSSKADKRDVDFIQQGYEILTSRTTQLERLIDTQNAKKQTLIDLGNMGVKGWAVFTGVILFAIAVFDALRKQ